MYYHCFSGFFSFLFYFYLYFIIAFWIIFFVVVNIKEWTSSSLFQFVSDQKWPLIIWDFVIIFFTERERGSRRSTSWIWTTAKRTKAKISRNGKASFISYTWVLYIHYISAVLFFVLHLYNNYLEHRMGWFYFLSLISFVLSYLYIVYSF